MKLMQQLFSTYVYENPLPQLRARNSAFLHLCQLPGGRILAAHQMGQAFESVDGTTFLSESDDGGRTWSAPRQAFDKSGEDVPLTDCAKLTPLPDGRLLAFGYEFFRRNPDLPIGNPQTGGLLDDQVYFSLSEDGGRTWSKHQTVPTAWNGHTEASAPLSILQDGSWATPITGFPNWEGKPVSRNCGRLLRSRDQGRTWNDGAVCMEFPGDAVTCYEQRMCQLEDGTLAVIGWNEDTASGKRLNNHVTISRDNGRTFSAPIDTGVHGQAASILAVGGGRVLSLHAVRRDTDAPGIYACLASLSGGGWETLAFERIWAPDAPMSQNLKAAEVFSFLKFGQPGLIRLASGEFLMYHWVCEDGCYKTCATGFSAPGLR